ncbi:MAG TPA: response regulator [Vicinamibacterales bacterium]|nr:response regulator [Vicinamibacterales bacterium]
MAAVLIVDDEVLIRWALRRYFEDRFEVLEAGDGSSALAQLERHDGKIVLGFVDLRLPDGDRKGLEILRVLKAHDPAAHAVVMTAFATPEMIEEAMAAGASAVIDKPFDLDAMGRMLDLHPPA